MSDTGLNTSCDPPAADVSRYRPYRPDLGDDFFSLLRRDRGFSYDDALDRGDADDSAGAFAPLAATALFWPGCTLSSYSRELTEATFRFLEERGMVDGMSVRCCGNIIRYAGGRTACVDYRSSLVSLLEARGVRRVVTACPNCYQGFLEMRQSAAQVTPPAVTQATLSATAQPPATQATLPAGTQPLAQPAPQLASPPPSQAPQPAPPIEVLVLSRLLADEGLRIPSDRIAPATTVCVHDTCPDRHCGVDAEAVRRLLKGTELREMKHNRSRSRCCGLGRLQFVSNPEASKRQRAERLGEFQATGAERLVTSCFSCANSLQDPSTGLVALHYLELLFDIRVDWSAVYQSSTRALATSARQERSS